MLFSYVRKNLHACEFHNIRYQRKFMNICFFFGFLDWKFINLKSLDINIKLHEKIIKALRHCELVLRGYIFFCVFVGIEVLLFFFSWNYFVGIIWVKTLNFEWVHGTSIRPKYIIQVKYLYPISFKFNLAVWQSVDIYIFSTKSNFVEIS